MVDMAGGDDVVFGVAPLKSMVWAREVPLGGGGSGLGIRFTSTQSGSGLGVKGLLGLLGLGKWLSDGGCTRDRAGRPLSSHHFRRSELAGGRPGSMES